jgi:hypothetical protein
MKSMTKFNEIEKKISFVVKQSEVFLPNDTIEDAKNLVEHREFGVALELICQQLYEFEIIVSYDLYNQIAELADLMQMPVSTHKFLTQT